MSSWQEEAAPRPALKQTPLSKAWVIQGRFQYEKGAKSWGVSPAGEQRGCEHAGVCVRTAVSGELTSKGQFGRTRGLGIAPSFFTKGDRNLYVHGKILLV